jgi:PucR C-terminal helix-turn-helix domain
VADYLASHLPGTADEIVAAMHAEIPAYREALEGPFGKEAARSVRLVLDQFVALVRYGEADLRPRRGLFRAFGREEARAGRSLDALLAAYRVGARLAWRRTRYAAAKAGLGTETMSLLAEATFAYIDELSALSAEGYADEQSARAEDLERRRAALVQLLTGSVTPERAAAEELALAARWPLPASLAALVWAPADHDRLLSRLPQHTIVAGVDGLACALVPDPDGPGRRAELGRAVRDLAVLGPTVKPLQAGRSLRRAADIHSLATRGLLARHGLVVAEEHLAEAVLYGSPELLADLAERTLVPLDRLSEKARARQAETLLAWLEHHGDTASVARRVHVHPQTVRYRLAQLRELFGEALDDPHARFELLLALRGSNAAPSA